uniref:Uncharacterized protein n=1 Tax=Alexandrium monilatum TaxID=311494 RepID=A0A7S4V581_9DINO|mmetsp:Transcript_31758/g.99103  ORF Transcript_31758/g.99103 Transcript_31758/m.99103 type:complete len:258 (+) Transcript_31758:103-876(+)
MASHAKHLLYAALAPTDAGKRTINIAGIFPEVFVASCLLLFTPPVVKSVYLAFDPLVSYWFDFKTKVVVALPAVFIGAGYVMQALRRAPRRGAIALSLLGPSMALAVQANNIAANALELSNDFAASDCEPFTRKYPLESSWQAASDFQKQCWSKVGEEYLLIHCHDYSEHAFKHPGWAFLENMEHRYVCSGWCHHRAPLWTTLPTADSCSTVVSQVLFAKVLRDSVQVVIYNFIVICLSIVALVLLGPTMREKGFDW